MVFFGDNGNEDMLLDRGTGGYWEGSYFTGMEASLRTPCLIRYPGEVPEGRSTNDIVHITDLFTTVLRWAGCDIPDDRIIDGVDHRDFFGGKQENSSREGFLFWNGERLYGVKWRHFKFVMVEQKYFYDPALPLAVPKIINLLVDPKEREAINYRHLHTWVLHHFTRLIGEFNLSTEKEPLIPFGCPLDYVPRVES